jgi:hypothetical protein
MDLAMYMPKSKSAMSPVVSKLTARKVLFGMGDPSRSLLQLQCRSW